jgi:hypothetical protein
MRTAEIKGYRVCFYHDTKSIDLWLIYVTPRQILKSVSRTLCISTATSTFKANAISSHRRLRNFGVGVVLRSEYDGVKVGDHIYHSQIREYLFFHIERELFSFNICWFVGRSLTRIFRVPGI